MGALNDSIHVLKQIQKHPEDERQILETLDMVWGLPLCRLFAWQEDGEIELWTIFWWHYFGGSLLVVRFWDDISMGFLFCYVFLFAMELSSYSKKYVFLS